MFYCVGFNSRGCSCGSEVLGLQFRICCLRFIDSGVYFTIVYCLWFTDSGYGPMFGATGLWSTVSGLWCTGLFTEIFH